MKNKQPRTTQKALAGKIGVTPEHLNAVLRRRTTPSVALAKKIECHMGIKWQSWFADPVPKSQEVA